MTKKFDRSLEKKLKSEQFAQKPEIKKANPVKCRTKQNPELTKAKILKRKSR